MSAVKKILITGGAGYIGSHTAVELIQSGYTPVILDNFSNSKKDVLKRLKKLIGRVIACYEGDCRDNDLINKVIKDEKIDGVIHFAAFKSVRESVNEPLKYYSNNLGSMVAVMQAMQENGVSKLVFSSSCTVYGQSETLPITEDVPLGEALAPYGTTKQMCERMIEDSAAAGYIKAVSLRYFNAIGAHSSGLLGENPPGETTFLIPSIMKAIKNGEKFTVLGNDYPTTDGTCIRDYIHVTDLARAHVAALDRLYKKTSGPWSVYNAGTGHGDSVMDVIKTFEKVTGKKLSYGFGPRGKGDAASAYAAVSKIKKELGWEAEKTLADALADAWRWQERLGNIGNVK